MPKYEYSVLTYRKGMQRDFFLSSSYPCSHICRVSTQQTARCKQNKIEASTGILHVPFRNGDLNCNALSWGSLSLSKNLKVCPATPPHPVGCQPAPLQATCRPTHVPHHASLPTHKFARPSFSPTYKFAQPRSSFGYSNFVRFFSELVAVCLLRGLEVYFWWSSGELFWTGGSFFLKSVVEPHVSCNHKTYGMGPNMYTHGENRYFMLPLGGEFLGQATYYIYLWLPYICI